MSAGYVLAALASLTPPHPDERLAAVEEHGRPWAVCNQCGAQWSINEAVPGGFSLERVTEGDGYCEEGGEL